MPLTLLMRASTASSSWRRQYSKHAGVPSSWVRPRSALMPGHTGIFWGDVRACRKIFLRVCRGCYRLCGVFGGWLLFFGCVGMVQCGVS